MSRLPSHVSIVDSARESPSSNELPNAAEEDQLAGSSLDAERNKAGPSIAAAVPVSLSRDASINAHPLVRQDVSVVTEPIREFFAQTLTEVTFGKNSLFVTGHDSDGVSCAIELTLEMMKDAFPNLYGIVYRLPEDKLEKRKIVAVNHLLKMGSQMTRGDPTDVRWRAINRYVSNALGAEMRSGQKIDTFLLCVDNAHLMTLPDATFFYDLRAELRSQNFRLVTLCAAREDDLTRLLRIRDGEKREEARLRCLLGGMCKKQLFFRGFQSENDVELLLRKIDEMKDQDGIGWTAFFLPHEVSRGYKLSDESKILSDALFGCSKVSREIGVPAASVFEVIRSYLVHRARADVKNGSQPAGPQFWRKLVDDAQVADAVREKHLAWTAQASGDH
ncbi:hypothetical protein [Paraburkholderia caribensis]|uniref:hypothetical protein n=1 Tax=Paraburkholderia caribensis TaxID=75105 RepID=UPI0034D2F00F